MAEEERIFVNLDIAIQGMVSPNKKFHVQKCKYRP
jgi:hypothetical protein